MLNTFDLTVPDMTCGHCVQSITQTVHQLDAQARVHCELSSHRVHITTSASREAITTALARQGYAEAGA
jgi:copper chaperone